MAEPCWRIVRVTRPDFVGGGVGSQSDLSSDCKQTHAARREVTADTHTVDPSTCQARVLRAYHHSLITHSSSLSHPSPLPVPSLADRSARQPARHPESAVALTGQAPPTRRSVHPDPRHRAAAPRHTKMEAGELALIILAAITIASIGTGCLVTAYVLVPQHAAIAADFRHHTAPSRSRFGSGRSSIPFAQISTPASYHFPFLLPRPSLPLCGHRRRHAAI